MRGRKPKPSSLAQLHGHPGKRERSKDEPQPPILDYYRAPTYLSEEARIEWERVVVELRAARIITVLDLGLVAGWCSAWADFVTAERQLRQEGLVVDSRDRGPVRNPWTMIKSKAIEQMIRIGSELGMSPASRPRLHASSPMTSVGPPPSERGPKMSLEDTVRIRNDGRVLSKMYLVQVKSPAASAYADDVYKMLSTTPGEEAFRPLTESQCNLIRT
jgi:P27 family predicted phage terminase small subunit